MGTFSDAIAAKPTPAGFVVLSPVHFAPEQNATGDVAIGIRLLSHDEILTATAEANRVVRDERLTGDEATDRHNEELMLWAIGFAATDPNDASERYFKLRESSARLILSPAGVRALWDALERETAAASPLVPLASDDLLADLGARLLEVDALAGLSPADTTRLRRWATLMHGWLLAAEPDLSDDD